MPRDRGDESYRRLVEEWLELTRRVTQLRSCYGVPGVRVRVEYPDGEEEWAMRIPQRPPVGTTDVREGPPAAAPAEWASGPVPKHNCDFTLVYFPGLTKGGLPVGPLFTFNDTQAPAVAALWEARFSGGCPDVLETELLQACDSNQARLSNVFRSGQHEAWGSLIERGEGSRPVKYRLAAIRCGTTSE